MKSVSFVFQRALNHAGTKPHSAGYTTCDFYSDGYKTGQWAKEYIEKNHWKR